jgi:cobyrinic acid a,c-diamide synthase
MDKFLALTCKEPLVYSEQAVVSHFPSREKVKIAIARDRAFGFYYADDLDALTAAGADLVPFDATQDPCLPDVDALYIGGGFPEVFAAELAANTSMRADIRRAIDAGMPAYAECGGLMYLSRSISYQGKKHDMVGAIPGDVVMHAKPIGRGYVHLTENSEHPWPRPQAQDKIVRAHEFHYSSLENMPADARFAYRMARGHGINGEFDGYIRNNLLASYTHLRTIGGCYWASRFVAFIRQIKQGGQAQPLQAA